VQNKHIEEINEKPWKTEITTTKGK